MLYCQKGFICLCDACLVDVDPYRRGLPGSTVHAGSTAAWLEHPALEVERRLAASAARLSHAHECGGPPSKMTAADATALAELSVESERVLGPLHFATQTFRRIALAQLLVLDQLRHGNDVPGAASNGSPDVCQYADRIVACTDYLTTCAEVLESNHIGAVHRAHTSTLPPVCETVDA